MVPNNAILHRVHVLPLHTPWFHDGSDGSATVSNGNGNDFLHMCKSYIGFCMQSWDHGSFVLGFLMFFLFDCMFHSFRAHVCASACLLCVVAVVSGGVRQP